MQGRVNNVNIHCGVFTNLTRDHLDYHGDMQSYADAKVRLFNQFNLPYAVINIDDPVGLNIINQLSADTELWRYGFATAQQVEVKGENLKLDRNGISFDVSTPQGNGKVTSQLLGAFNASNLLAVLTVLLIHSVPLKGALARLSIVQAVPGRMEKINTEQGKPIVVIDYAHTPDALQQALTSLKQHAAGRLWCVFGCGGNRDKGKRPVMGEIAETHADYIVLTNDNPRNENPMDIIMDIQQGMKTPDAVHIETDRRKAILYALQHCDADDIVLIAGKGHESWQIIGEDKIPFSDSETVRTLLGMRQV
jgi:UDP-N-acetylmuramoyl-L-alanyl-D-glutamate--2,6-diaminopimelate ligase